MFHASISQSCNILSTDYVSRYATKEALQEQEKHLGNGLCCGNESSDSGDESSMSDFSEDGTETMEL